MDLRHMRHFIAVSEELHFGKAARRLNMAQPPLSQSIRRLEMDIGVRLFERSRRGVLLTDAGRAYLVEARRTLMQAELAGEIARRAATKTPEVRISFVGPALYRVLPALIARHRAQRPGVLARLYERRTPDQCNGLLQGEFEIGFVMPGIPLPEASETLVVERAAVVAAVPADSALAQEASITLAALADEPFILPPQRYMPLVAEPMAALGMAGFSPKIVQEATQTNTTISLVGAGVGCSLVMASAMRQPSPNVRFLRLRGDVSLPPWELKMVWLPDHIGRQAADFLQLVRDFLQDHPEILDPAAPVLPHD